MLKRVVAVDAATPATSAIRLFDEYGVNVMPVVDRGILVGAVFRSDLVRRLLLPHAFGRRAEPSTVS
jgi:CBS domain-containing protein